MPKIDLQDVESLTNEQSALSRMASNNAVIETESDSFLSRDGTSPNQMEADLDMNSNRIINLPLPISANEPARKIDLDAVSAGGIGVSSVGLVAYTDNSPPTFDTRIIETSGEGLEVVDGDGSLGNPTLALANDVAAVEGLATTGIAVRTGTDTWNTRSITGSNGISITNGTGVAGNIDISNSTTASVITVGSTGDFTAERVLTAGTGIGIVDGGPNSTVTLSVADDGVANTKLANMATQTIKGRNTAGTGDPEDLAPATVKTVLGYPNTSTDNRVTRMDGTSGGLQQSTAVLDDSGNLSGINNITNTGYLDISELVGVVATPAADTGRLFVKDNGSGTSKLYFKDPAGTETDILAGGGGGGSSISYSSVQGLSLVQQAVALQNIGANQFNLINGKLTESRSASAATFAIKGLDGNNPSASNPVLVIFGDGTQVTLTSALSVTISSGSTLGTSNGIPFRLWVVIINDSGTLRLGVRNCRATGRLSGFPSNGIITTTAEGGFGAADNAAVTYSGVAATAKQFRIVGYADYESGQSTAGAWVSAPTRIQQFGPGMHKPGDVVAIESAEVINSPTTITSTTIAATTLTVSITPTSNCNPISLYAGGPGVTTSSTYTLFVRLMRGGSAIGASQGLYSDSVSVAAISSMSLGAFDFPATSSSTTYAVGAYNSAAAKTSYFPHPLSDASGGGFISATELMG